jgi:hypothetical protein
MGFSQMDNYTQREPGFICENPSIGRQVLQLFLNVRKCYACDVTYRSVEIDLKNS